MNNQPQKSFLMTNNHHKYQITAGNSSFAKKMEIAKLGMKKYKNALAKLAK